MMIVTINVMDISGTPELCIACQMLNHVILVTTLEGRYYHPSHFPDEKRNGQRVNNTLEVTQVVVGKGGGLKSRQPVSKSAYLNTISSFLLTDVLRSGIQ